MLRDLLRLIVSGELASPAEAAAKLGAGEDAIADMLERLVILGYLEDMSKTLAEAACSSGCKSCAGCPMAGGCHGGVFRESKGKVWAVTVKGRKAAEESGGAGL